MKKLLFAVAAMFIAAPVFAADKAASTTTDKTAATATTNTKGEDAIKAVFAQVDAGFAAHDAKAFSALFADDATLVQPQGDGKILKGRAAIEASMAQLLAGENFKGVTVKHTVENVRWIGKDGAFVDVTANFTGMQMPAGAPTPVWHAVGYLTLKGGKWLLTDVRPYAIMPPPPMAPSKPT